MQNMNIYIIYNNILYITITFFNKINKKIDEHNLTFIHLHIRSLNHNFEYFIDF